MSAMNFIPTPLAGVWLIEPQRREDERGWFARTFCEQEFSARGLIAQWPQCSTSFNAKKGTLRGLHWQAAPHAETKLVRCTRGALWDVVVDLRADSPTFRKWFATELTPDNGRAHYIPAGCAHGFQTLADDTEVFYQISVPHHSPSARGARWNDPAFGIAWPLPCPILSPADENRVDFSTLAP